MCLQATKTPDEGEITLDGRNLTTVPAHERGIGFVSQGFALFPHLSVFDNVAFGLRYHAHAPLRDGAELRRRVLEILDMVGLAEFAQRQIQQLSGGQRQRVALARTLVVRPRLCLLDEPLGALDANLRQRMTAELRRIHASLGITFFHVTGNEMEALAMGDRVVVLDAGRILQVDAPDTSSITGRHRLRWRASSIATTCSAARRMAVGASRQRRASLRRLAPQTAGKPLILWISAYV